MAEALKRPVSYEEDFYAWTVDQAAKLRMRLMDAAADGIDWPNLIEEIETLGRVEKRETRRFIGNILLELLKWRILEGSRCGSLRCRIEVERMELRRQLLENASLRQFLSVMIVEEYKSARLRFVADTGLVEATNPLSCPFTIEEILDPDFYPEDAA